MIFVGGGSAKKRGKDYQSLCSIDIVPQGFIPARKQILGTNSLITDKKQIHRSQIIKKKT